MSEVQTPAITIETRIKIWEAVKEKIQSYQYTYLCEALAWEADFKLGTTLEFYEVPAFFPEMEKYRPRKSRNCATWFSGEKSRSQRIQACESIIADLKKQL